jgi:hypothetical protein
MFSMIGFLQIRSEASAELNETGVVVTSQSSSSGCSRYGRLEQRRMRHAAVVLQCQEEKEIQEYFRQYSHKSDILPVDPAKFWSDRQNVISKSHIIPP